MSLSPGTRLGSYEVTALIGQGGMGGHYMVKQVKRFSTVFFSYNTSRVGSPRRATCQNELVTKPGFTNYESVRFFGGRAFASCERR